MAARDWLSVAEVAEMLGLHARTVRRHILEDGAVPHARIGRSIRVRRTEVDDWLRRLETVPATGTEHGRNPDF